MTNRCPQCGSLAHQGCGVGVTDTPAPAPSVVEGTRLSDGTFAPTAERDALTFGIGITRVAPEDFMREPASPPREWWINEDTMQLYDNRADAEIATPENLEFVFKVIEKSAYDALKAERDELSERFDDARKAALCHTTELSYRGKEIDILRTERADMRTVLEKIVKDYPGWNVGDIASAVLKKYT